MGAVVQWLLELSITDGKADAFKSLICAIVSATDESEPGTLIYEYYFNEDETVCHVFERYENSAATMAHLKTFNETYAPQFFTFVKPVKMTVFGDASDEVREAINAFKPVYLKEETGFAR